jgi:hypothetical protein
MMSDLHHNDVIFCLCKGLVCYSIPLYFYNHFVIKTLFLQLKQESRNKLSDLKNENMQLAHSLQMKQNELLEAKQLQQLSKR